jgi:hypothetical protein
VDSFHHNDDRSVWWRITGSESQEGHRFLMDNAANQVAKVLTALIGVALVTTLILNGHQTASVLSAAGTAFNGALGTAIEG